MAERSEERDAIIRRRLFAATGRTPVERPTPPPRGLAAWLEERVPAPVLALRDVGWQHVGVLAFVVSAALLVGAWWIARSSPAGEFVPPPAPVSSSAAAVDPPVAEVVVDVAGRVRRPGVYHLPAGARVIDAIEAAGGPLRGVDLGQVNQARVLVDGEQILLVGRHQAAGPSAGSATGGRVNINTADQALLETLPGVGPVTAESILRWREENGPFTSVEGLLEVSGIGEVTLEHLRPYVTV